MKEELDTLTDLIYQLSVFCDNCGHNACGGWVIHSMLRQASTYSERDKCIEQLTEANEYINSLLEYVDTQRNVFEHIQYLINLTINRLS